eukprot:TRINITY_DN5643_c0_g1_i1.p1 TRINITY_DN5643_c0_g1~~TRINITY_DN5643_c0_g1_i1.p1  ORF type:complete len:411 (-),score=108.62 TRINITY_DN5643_c0_g1_i1:172-1404(-)
MIGNTTQDSWAHGTQKEGKLSIGGGMRSSADLGLKLRNLLQEKSLSPTVLNKFERLRSPPKEDVQAFATEQSSEGINTRGELMPSDSINRQNPPQANKWLQAKRPVDTSSFTISTETQDKLFECVAKLPNELGRILTQEAANKEHFKQLIEREKQLVRENVTMTLLNIKAMMDDFQARIFSFLDTEAAQFSSLYDEMRMRALDRTDYDRLLEIETQPSPIEILMRQSGKVDANLELLMQMERDYKRRLAEFSSNRYEQYLDELRSMANKIQASMQINFQDNYKWNLSLVELVTRVSDFFSTKGEGEETKSKVLKGDMDTSRIYAQSTGGFYNTGKATEDIEPCFGATAHAGKSIWRHEGTSAQKRTPVTSSKNANAVPPFDRSEMRSALEEVNVQTIEEHLHARRIGHPR